MAHPSLTDLVDAARGTLPAATKAGIAGHVRDCRECAEAVATWRAFADFAWRDGEYEPPAGSVRVAKSYFAATCLAEDAATRRKPLVPPIVPTLIFDSFSSGAMGVRSAGASGSRHLLYEAAPLSIDLQLQEDARGILLTGQISDATCPPPALPAHVVLMRGATEVARFDCNEFGEFDGDCDRLEDLSLVIGREPSIVIPLSRLDRDA